MKAKNNIRTLDQFKDIHYGKAGTEKRDELETGYENFKIGAMIQNARLQKGLTQEELAEKLIKQDKERKQRKLEEKVQR